MRLLIMGPQGVGKGTQAALLAEHFNIDLLLDLSVYLSTNTV
jgi:adk: adenylate kinases